MSIDPRIVVGIVIAALFLLGVIAALRAGSHDDDIHGRDEQ